MERFWSFLIVTACCAASITAIARGASTAPALADSHYGHAVTIYQCSFDNSTDANADGWPDDWTRERSANYPPYVPIAINSAGPPGGGQSLHIELDGGAAAAYSPPIPVQAIFNYVFQCQVRTDGLQHDRAYLSVTFYDIQNKVLERQLSSSIGSTTPWTKLRIGPTAPASTAAHHAIVGLHLEPNGRPDLHGSAWFADVWAGRLPRIVLTVEQPNHLYVDPQRPVVRCTASGFENGETTANFQLFDVDGREVAREQLALDAQPTTLAADKSADSGILNSGRATESSSSTTVFSGGASWKPPLPDVGFYKIAVALSDEANDHDPHEIRLALVRQEANIASGNFGWELSGESPLTLDQWAWLARQGAIQRLKLPLWAAADDPQHCDRLARFAGQLQNDGVQLIGILADPPAAVRKQFPDSDEPLAAQIFSSEPDVWYPSVEPLLLSLSLRVRQWQLGRDNDLSFVNFTGLPSAIAKVRKQMSKFGPTPQLGVGWSQTYALPPDSGLDFISLPADPPLVEAEQMTKPTQAAGGKSDRWYVVELPQAANHAANQRAAELVRQLLSAKLQGAGGIFVADVCNSQRGLLDDDGTVGELFLPWRTTALAISGADDLGSVRLPGGSSNRVFSRDGHATMLVWNQQPRDETVFLGTDARQSDVWGRTTPLTGDLQGKQTIHAAQLPTFIGDVNEPLVRWQISLALAHPRWPCEFGFPQGNAVQVQNPFTQPVTGVIRLVLPDRWRASPREIGFKLAAGETAQLPFSTVLPLDTTCGRHDVQLDFEISADQHYQFSVFRTIEIGYDDVSIELSTRLDEAGNLLVAQKFINHTNQPVSFKCSLYAPERRRMVEQVIDQGRGADLKTFRITNGRDLVGKTLWLKAEEMNGQRTLNYRFPAQQ
ncbi:MAG TPA: hypothetical protein VGJ15_04565 [Pirellulales bacterium]